MVRPGFTSKISVRGLPITVWYLNSSEEKFFTFPNWRRTFKEMADFAEKLLKYFSWWSWIRAEWKPRVRYFYKYVEKRFLKTKTDISVYEAVSDYYHFVVKEDIIMPERERINDDIFYTAMRIASYYPTYENWTVARRYLPDIEIYTNEFIDFAENYTGLSWNPKMLKEIIVTEFALGAIKERWPPVPFLLPSQGVYDQIEHEILIVEKCLHEEINVYVHEVAHAFSNGLIEHLEKRGIGWALIEGIAEHLARLFLPEEAWPEEYYQPYPETLAPLFSLVEYLDEKNLLKPLIKEIVEWKPPTHRPWAKIQPEELEQIILNLAKKKLTQEEITELKTKINEVKQLEKAT